MNDEQFEATMECLRDELADKLRARDTAQREALARVEADREFLNGHSELMRLHAGKLQSDLDNALAQLAEAVGLLTSERELREHLGIGGPSLLNLVRFLDRHAQAEQQEAHGAQAADARKTKIDWVNDYRVRHGVSLRVAAKAYESRAALATQPAAKGESK